MRLFVAGQSERDDVNVLSTEHLTRSERAAKIVAGDSVEVQCHASSEKDDIHPIRRPTHQRRRTDEAELVRGISLDLRLHEAQVGLHETIFCGRTVRRGFADLLERASRRPKVRRPTTLRPAAREKRLDVKRRRSQVKALRGRTSDED